MVLGDKRTFKVVDVRKHGGCDTKFKGGRFVSRTASGAARKAFNALCRVKKIRGKCTLTVVMKETTKGSAGKQYAYKLHRNKLTKPLVMMRGTPQQYKIEYEITAESLKGQNLEKCLEEKKGKTSGVMARRSKRLAVKNAKKAKNSKKMSRN